MSSLPPAPKDISAHPAKGSVVDPVDKKAKNADVERKLKFYTTLQAFRESKLPTNAQLDKWITFAINNSPIDSHHPDGEEALSRDGRKLVGDVRDVLETLRVILREKNGDEILQEFIWNTRDVDGSGLKNSSIEGAQESGAKGGTKAGATAAASVDKDKMKEDANTAAHHLRTVLHLLLTNSEARKLVSDFSVVGRDLASKGLSKASEELAPSEEELKNVDEAHTGAGGAFKGDPRERAKEQEERGITGMAQDRLPGQVQPDQHDPIFAKAGELMSPQEGSTKETAQDLAGQAKREVVDESGAGERLDRIRDSQGQEISPSDAEETKVRAREATEEAKKRGLVGRMVGGVREGFGSQIPQEHQDKAKAHFQRGKEFLKEEYFPKERRDQWIWRAKKVIVECQQHSDYQESLRWLLEYVREYAGHGRRIATEKGGDFQDGVNDDGLQTSLSQLRELLERFANGRSLQDDVWDPINVLIDDAQRDEELRGWWKDVGDYVEKVLLTPGYVLEPAANTRGRELLEAGQKFYGSGNESLGGDPDEKPQGTGGATKGPTTGAFGIPGAGVGASDTTNTIGNASAYTGTTPATGALGIPGARAGAASGTNVDGLPATSTYAAPATTAGAPVPTKGADAERAEKKETAAVRGKYREHFDRVFEGVGAWVGGVREDRLNKRLGTDLQRFTKDLLFSNDGEGGLKFKKELWNDIRRVIIPMLVDRVGYIPIPRIEYTDDTLDLVVENLTLSGRNLFPNVVEIETHNYLKSSPYANVQKGNREANDTSKHEFKLTFGQIQADMRDVAFYFRKKSGLPKLKDSGLADILIGGEGMTATVHLTSSQDPSTLFAIKSVNVKVDTLKFAIRDSKHDLLYKTLRPLATGLVKKQIQKAVADGLRTALEWVGEELVAVRERMEEARMDAKEGDGQEEIGRFKAMQEAFKRRKDETSSITSGSTSTRDRHSQFKVVANKRNSLLAHEGHPAGWVNRTAEREKLIEKGEGWRSDAFNVV